jgi:hypothetical protein
LDRALAELGDAPLVADLRQALAGAERPDEVRADRPPRTAATGWWTDDAGLVLLAVYLPALFERAGLVEDGVLAGNDAAARAFGLLDFALWGGARPERARPGFVASLLVGGEPGRVRPWLDAPPDADARALVDGLLEAVIRNWSTLGNTSIGGLREAFLQRPGILRVEPEQVRLRVEGRAYDMLLDRLPWSYAVVRQRWMPLPLMVEWRP